MHIYDTSFWMLMNVIVYCTYYIYQFTYITYIILLHISIFMNNDILCSSNVRSLWIIFPIYYIFDKDIDIFSHYRINSYYLLWG